MAFTLHTPDGTIELYGDKDRYTFNEYGLLVLVTEDGRRRVFAPGAWSYVEVPPTPRP